MTRQGAKGLGGQLSPAARIASYAAAAWLLAIAGNLVLNDDYDIAVRDVNMALGPFALAQLSGAREQETHRLQASQRLEEAA